MLWMMAGTLVGLGGGVAWPQEEVLRVNKLSGRKLVAQVIYADIVEAHNGRVANWVDNPFAPDAPGTYGEQDLKIDEAQANTVFAREIKVDWLDATQVHARRYNVGNGDSRDDD